MSFKQYQKDIENIKKEVNKVIIGQETVLDGLIKALLVNAHVLVEGVPGIAKTLIIRAIARATGCKFSRIQFTVDLLPTDITGITVYSKGGFSVVKGPLFANFVLADEINRAPPKVQSALLEAMAEKQTTIGKETFPMMAPFFVMATQNPIESVATYDLPEAQLDRFLFKLIMNYPSLREEKEIIDVNIEVKGFNDYNIKKVISPKILIEMQKATKKIFLNERVKDYITRVVDATRFPDKYNIVNGKYIEYGCSPRASIGLALAGRAHAMTQGRNFVIPQDIKDVAKDVLRHRIILTYEGLAKKIMTDEVIDEIISKVRSA